MAKRGPGRPSVITEEVTSRILAILTAGGSLSDAADVVGVGYQSVVRKRRSDAVFGNRLRKAVKEGKLNLIRKVGTAKPWQAAAFMLERKWWQEYSKHDRVRTEHVGDGGGAIKHESKVNVDFAAVERSVMEWEIAKARAGSIGALESGLVPSNGN